MKHGIIKRMSLALTGIYVRSVFSVHAGRMLEQRQMTVATIGNVRCEDTQYAQTK